MWKKKKLEVLGTYQILFKRGNYSLIIRIKPVHRILNNLTLNTVLNPHALGKYTSVNCPINKRLKYLTW